MDDIGISRSILSISTPGTHLVTGDNALAGKITRHCNSYAASLKRKHPDKFGFWASLPLPDIQTSLTEIETATNEGADGFCLLTNAHGHYLGDSIFDPIFEELNRRKAIVFIHPTTPCIACHSDSNGLSQPIKATPFEGRLPNPMLEFFFDTARAITNLFLLGTVKRYPDIKYIIPHAGGAMPPLLSRFTGFSTLIAGPWESSSEEEVREAFERQFWFDLAGFPFPGQIKGLLAVGVGAQKLLYGSDYCFTKAEGVIMLARKMDEGVKGIFTEKEVEEIYYGNATKLLENHSLNP